MKKLYSLLLILLVSVAALHAQTLSYDQLKQQFDQLNQQMPMSMGPTTRITSITFNPKKLTYYGEVLLVTTGQEPDTTAMKQAVIYNLSVLKDNNMKIMFESLAQLGISMSYVFSYAKDNRKVSFTITPLEMRDLLSAKVSPKQALNNMIAQRKGMLPLDTGNGVVLTNYYINGNNVEALYSVDEAKTNMTILIQNKALLKQNLLQMLSKDITSVQELKIISMAGYGCSFYYKGTTSGKSMRIVITLAEIKQIIASAPVQ